MKDLRNRLEAEFKTILEPHKPVAEAIARKLQEQGIALNDQGKLYLEEKLLQSNLEDCEFSFEDEHIETGKSNGLPANTDSIELTDTEVDELTRQAEERAAELVPIFTDEFAESMLKVIKRDASCTLGEQRQDRSQFESRHYSLWEKPLDFLELFVLIARQVGSEFNSESREDGKRLGDAKFEALTRLHARACQVSSEILVLLHAGFADGAHARWRTLHEIAIVASFLRKNSQDLAERYLQHEIIQQYKLACQHQSYWERIRAEPLSQEEFENLKSMRDQLVVEFGDSFKNDYGWASSVVGSKSPTLSSIAKLTNLDHMSPYYKMASDNIHANSHGASFRLGSSLHPNRLLLAGPSNMGLADPGHSTAISLNLVTASLVTTSPDFACIVVLKILKRLVDDIGEAFLEVHNELQAIAETEDIARSDNGDQGI